MTPLAKQALDRARHKPLSARKPVERRPASAPEALPPVGELVIPTGPHNHVMFLEGRHYAIELVQSMSSLASVIGGELELIEHLNRAASGRPASYMRGVASIIELIREQA